MPAKVTSIRLRVPVLSAIEPRTGLTSAVTATDADRLRL